MAERTPIGVLTHIEKTGGVSVDRALGHAVGKKSVLVYSPKVDRLARESDIPIASPTLEFMRRALATPVVGAAIATVWAGSDRAYRHRLRRKYPEVEIPEDAKVLTGHFVADQFDPLLGDRQPIRGIMLREPLDRMISHYKSRTLRQDRRV